MRSWIDSVGLSASTLRVRVPEPLPADQAALAVASAIRVFARFPALDGLVLVSGGTELSISRSDVERMLAPEGWAGLQDRGRWPEVLARAIERYAARPS